ncbi:MAG: phosphoribosylformylglycinamidine synthase [Candidatus Izemoplasma sp.]|nr:phosphoribosylformylglycinamidine synthase [Candidatus Izemoplasma sp.]
MKKRLFIERNPSLQIETETLKQDIKDTLMITLPSLRYFIIYDLFDIDQYLLTHSLTTVFSEPNRDNIYETLPETLHHIAIESLPGQFNQRADSAMQCLQLLDPSTKATVTSGFVICFNEVLTQKELKKLKQYLINPVESQEKNLSVLTLSPPPSPKPIGVHKGFINRNQSALKHMHETLNLAMSLDDLLFIQDYFIAEDRDPTETEIKILDTYWSDHCRHTTFETALENITFSENNLSQMIKSTFEDYLHTRNITHRTTPLTLMDLATINARLERHLGHLDDLELSEEVNAASIEIEITVDGKKEPWLLMFKNETHNHPTEIEPFGGASTCIGGAIRDPLSGRSYVYSAMRITGAADITEPVNKTLDGKLPQKVISKEAARGYASYGNQIGLPTTYVKALFHPGYKAKRMEIGAVIGAVKKMDLVRQTPIPGDVILVLGGKTGRDGIGGATGSSKRHTPESIDVSASEVQKGNAPEERKIQRLFRHPNVSKMIKKANDFGAGGVSVAIGELCDGVQINLDKLKTKYDGINGTELAISESQERMAVVVSKEDVRSFKYYCKQENIEVTKVADVTDDHYLTMTWQNNVICRIKRSFLETAGVRQTQRVSVNQSLHHNPLNQRFEGDTLESQFHHMLKAPSIASMQGLSDMFDASIGRTTVLAPYGGKYQLTKTQASVHKIPVKQGITDTVSLMAYGFDPFVSEKSPYVGSAYAVIESMAKIVACGGNHQSIRFTFQEYFERLEKDPDKWAKPFTALLGAYHILKGFHLAAVGGKDSMSGTYQDLHVPPTLVSFAVTHENSDHIISPEFKQSDHYLYLFDYDYSDAYLPNLTTLKTQFDMIYHHITTKQIVSARAITTGGIAESLAKSSFGNKIGVTVATVLPLFQKKYGAILVESKVRLEGAHIHYLGQTTSDPVLHINGIRLSIDDAIQMNRARYKDIYPLYAQHGFQLESDAIDMTYEAQTYPKKVSRVTVLQPVFPGTNCEYDTMAAFKHKHVFVKTLVFNNQNETQIKHSIKELVKWINKSHILMFSGGFSSGDEPDGSGKFIANVLRHKEVKEAIHSFLDKKHLILGICNGFQALVKSGLLPYGHIQPLTSQSPTLHKNTINRHVSRFVNTQVSSIKSPWLSSFSLGDIHTIPVSHTEGNFTINESLYRELKEHGQIAFQYVDYTNQPSCHPKFNPNGSDYAIEGIISLNGLILGKMGHSERYAPGLFKNITGNLDQNIFRNGIQYFLQGGHNE